MEVDFTMNDSKRATIYFEPRLHEALKMKAVKSAKSVSELVNEAVRYSIAEDVLDFKRIEERGSEAEREFEKFAKELKKDGLI